MKSRRTAKVAQAILQSISSTILFGLRDPRVRNVTILSVEVSPDIRTAKVYVSIMGDEKTQALCMHGLNSARGFLQAKCADRLQTRYTPVLKFVLDESIKKCTEHGGEVIVPARQMGASSFCVIRDPAGAACALFQSGGD